MKRNFLRSALLLSGSAGAAMLHFPVKAQVAPTEVNEEAVDEFGLERKTGRFTWSTGEIIGIGGEQNRISVNVHGVNSPPHAINYFHGGPSLPVVLNQPSVSIAPFPVDFPRFPGEINPSRNYVTVDYSGGSHTFECTGTVCISQYFLSRFGLQPQGAGYVLTDPYGTTVFIEPGRSIVTYTDGRQEIITSDGSRRNNAGFILKRTTTGTTGFRLTAINMAVNYCSDVPGVSCASPTQQRFATVPASTAPVLDIVDAAGGITKLRWENRTAKEVRPPIGYPIAGSPTIRDITARYLMGVTLPGQTTESITVLYKTIDPAKDTHDDVRVSRIIRDGVTVDYEIVDYWPYGKAIELVGPVPDDGGSMSGREGGGRLAQEDWRELLDARNEHCTDESSTSNFDMSLCSGGAGDYMGGSPGSAWTLPPSPVFETAPPDENGPPSLLQGSEIYELTITARVNSAVVSTSFALRPYQRKGMARRNLLWVRDGVGRETQYSVDRYDNVGGVRNPEGNQIYNEYDLRGNISKTIATAKTAGQPDLATAYSYTPDCDNANIAWCNRPVSVTDPNGNVTNYEYNQYGQVTKEMKPAASPGAARPTVINEYTLRTAYIKNSAGAPVAAGPAISLLSRSYTCISSATCNASTPAADKVVTDYDYGPTTGLNNLLLRGIAVTAVNDQGQIQTLRTCYGYNYFGERISETLPKAGLSSCPA
jgi:hypothetical protein